jgi:hypothetical protein
MKASSFFAFFIVLLLSKYRFDREQKFPISWAYYTMASGKIQHFFPTS